MLKLVPRAVGAAYEMRSLFQRATHSLPRVKTCQTLAQSRDTSLQFHFRDRPDHAFAMQHQRQTVGSTPAMTRAYNLPAARYPHR